MKRRNQRGFSLPVVVTVMGITTISAAVLLDIIQIDHQIQGAERLSLEARLTAEGGMLELLNDRRLQAELPEFDDPGMRVEVLPPNDSEFESHYTSYSAHVSLVRMAPIMESSQGSLEAVVYELEVDGIHDKGGRSEVRAEIYKFVSRPRGLIQGDRHAR